MVSRNRMFPPDDDVPSDESLHDADWWKRKGKEQPRSQPHEHIEYEGLRVRTGCFIVLGVAIAAVPLMKCMDYIAESSQKNNLLQACEVDPSLGTSVQYVAADIDGRYPHAIMQTADKKNQFVVYVESIHKTRQPVHVFHDANNNEVLDGKEELQIFSKPEDAKLFLTKEAFKLNASQPTP